MLGLPPELPPCTPADARRWLHMAACHQQLMLHQQDMLGPDLPMAAAEALAAGLDSPWLRRAAGGDEDHWESFRWALEELGIALPELDEARRTVRCRAAVAMLSGSFPPELGSELIYWQIHWADRDPDDRTRSGNHLAVLNELSYDWSYPDTREQAEQGMLHFAADLLRFHHWTLTVVVDDERTLRRVGAIHARTSASALALLDQSRGLRIDELWLDHDLGGDDTVMPVVHRLEKAAFHGEPFDIGTIYVHTANPVGAATILRSKLLNETCRVVRTDLSRFV